MSSAMSTNVSRPGTGDQKILFFITGMSAGGAERVVATLATFLAQRGYPVTIAMLKGEESAYDLGPGVRIVSAGLTPGLRNLPLAIAFYRRIVRDEKPSVVASFSTKSDLIALFVKVLLRLRVRVIVSERADPYSRGPLMQFAINRLYRHADAVVCQGELIADYYRRRLGRNPVKIIENPLNLEAVGEPNKGPRKPVVIMVGRLSDQKNHRLAFRAFARVRANCPELTLRVYGTGPLERDLDAAIQAEGLGDAISLPGVLPNAIRFHADAALFLFTSNYEGFPNALLEAAATGLPVVTTDFSPGTAREIIQHGLNGFVVPVGDQEGLESAMTAVLGGALTPAALEAEAKRVRLRHNVEQVGDTWLSVLVGRPPLPEGRG